MTERRCPSCGGLVAEDAGWCGQCLTRLDQPPPPGPEGSPEEGSPPAPVRDPPGPEVPRAGPAPRSSAAGAPGVRVEGEDVLWTCPTCGSENRLEDRACRSCGTPFRELFEEPTARPLPAPGRAVALSLLFPGAGHVAAGRVAEGVARAVVFAFALGTVLAIVLSRRGLGLGPFLALVGTLAAAAGLLYGLTAVDAHRLARGQPQIVTTRVLLYGATGLIVLTIAVLVLAGVRATPG